MAETSLDTEFRAAVQEDGDAYRVTRKAIFERGAAALGFLDAHRGSSDWKISVTAEILAGWIQTPEIFNQVTDAVQGELLGPLPITGSFAPKRRIAEIQRLGKSAVPRLLEMAWKTREYGGLPERATVFGALAVLKDDRAVPPLIDLMETARDQDIRGWAASTLGVLKDSRAVQPLLDVLLSQTASDEVRASVATSLGSLGAKQAAPELRKIVLDERADLDLRKSAVRSLADLGDSSSAERLLSLFDRSHDLAFELVLLDAVGKLGGTSILPQLVELETSHHEAPVREAAKEAAEEIKERSGAKK